MTGNSSKQTIDAVIRYSLFVIRGGLIALAALMPFHAFLVVAFSLPPAVQAWKELLAVMLALAVTGLIWHQPAKRPALKHGYLLAAGLFVLAGLLASLLSGAVGSAAWWHGVKTDTGFLIVFAAGHLVPGLQTRRTLVRLLWLTAALVALLAWLQAWVIPVEWLTNLGYNATTIRPEQGVDPGSDLRRAFSTLGGPNQLGAFLILPLCYVLAAWFKSHRPWHLPVFMILAAGLLVTYSRSAWLGTAVGLAVTAILAVKGQHQRLAVLSGLLVLVLGSSLLLNLAAPGSWLATIISHNSTTALSSDEERLLAQSRGLAIVRQDPQGLGFGAAGPASYYGPRPLITENHYLQLAVETGLLGLTAFVAFLALFWRRLLALRHIASAQALAGAMIGISIVNFFLHGWADSSLAYVYWGLAGVVAGTKT